MKKNVYSIIVLLVFIGIFAGCQMEEESFNENVDSVFLNLPANTDFNNLAKSDLEIVSRAFVRLDIKENEDGLFVIKQNRGAKVNISEELFGYFQTLIEKANERTLASGIEYSRNRVKTRQESIIPQTDCVAYAIAYAAGGGFDTIDSWITDNYGNNGVPSDQFYNVMNHFFEGVQVSHSKFDGMDISGGNYIIVINNSHAVNVVAKTGSTILYYDPQSNQYQTCSSYFISHIYEVR